MNVTAENIACRKCKVVGIQNFVRRIEYLEGGSADSIICLICGDRLASQPVTVKMERNVPPSETGHQGVLDQPCTVDGCPGMINAAKNKSGLCNGCSHTLSNWKNHGSKGLPPFIRTLTGYIARAAYQSRHPSEVPATISGKVGTVVLDEVFTSTLEEVVLIKVDRHTHWTPCAKEGCPRRLRPDRVAAGDTRCSYHTRTMQSMRSPFWTQCATSDCTRQLRPSSIAAGHTLCGKCRQRAAKRAARTLNQEVTHVEVTQSLPCLAPPAPPAPAVRHQSRRPAQLRRDDHQGVNELSRLLAPLGLYPDAATIASWSAGERREVEEFVKSMASDQTLLMPDVLCPIYDDAYAQRSA